MRIRQLIAVAALGLTSTPMALPALDPLDPFALARATATAEEATPYLVPDHTQPCVGGLAGGVYPCDEVDLVEFMPHTMFGTNTSCCSGVRTNSLWGWTDPLDGDEYVLLGLNNGTAFIDITDPENPVYLGKLPTHAGTANIWRDVRVYQNHAYIVSEQSGHGMQVFDLTQLRSVASPPATFAETAFYDKVSNTHTISINEATGYAYLVGTTGTGGHPNVVTCGGNVHIVSLANPAAPQFVACYDDGGYVHENQCFVYHGPDTDHTGKEICLAARGSTRNLDILDATNHAAPVRLDSFHYADGSGFSHQAWFTEDHRYILLNDELDENGSVPTRTWIFDAADLDNVVAAGPGFHDHATVVTDHNLYVRGDYVFQSNYRAGLRILRLADVANADLEEVAYFDVYPGTNDTDAMNGSWNNYPFFESGVIPVSHIEQGLFLVKPTGLCLAPTPGPTGLVAAGAGDNRIDLDWSGTGAPGATFAVERALGGCDGTFEEIATGLTSPEYSDFGVSAAAPYGYRVRETPASGLCPSEFSSCVEASTTGACNAPPLFSGLTSATDLGSFGCAIELAWSAAQSFCGGPATYSVYRGATPDFAPSAANRIAENVAASPFVDATAPSLVASHYIVRAIDEANGAEDGNLRRLAATATGPYTDGTFATGAEPGDAQLDASGTSGFAPEHAGWHITDAISHAPSDRSFWSTESDNLCVTLEGTFELTAGESSTLSFWTAWDIEAGWDGGVVELSPTGGPPWTRLTPSGGYPGTITSGGTLCGIAQGSGAFTGMGALTFTQKSISLSAWAGQTVRLRFNYRTDSNTAGDGWYIDDVAITHAQVPGACFPDALFADDFESGDSDAWDLTVVD